MDKGRILQGILSCVSSAGTQSSYSRKKNSELYPIHAHAQLNAGMLDKKLVPTRNGVLNCTRSCWVLCQ